MKEILIKDGPDRENFLKNFDFDSKEAIDMDMLQVRTNSQPSKPPINLISGNYRGI